MISALPTRGTVRSKRTARWAALQEHDALIASLLVVSEMRDRVDSHATNLTFVRFRRIDLRQEKEGELIVFQHPYKLGTICITGS